MPFFHNLRGVFRVAVFFLLGGTGILGVALLALYVFLRVTVLHPINAETEVEQRQATIKLTFDYILENRDGVVDESNSGRFLTVWIPRTRLTHKMCGYDWAHRGRTGIYVVGQHDLAVIGVDGCDYLVAAQTKTVSRVPRSLPSEDWVYLGAFDWITRILPTRGSQVGGHHRFFRFIPAAEQGECIMDGSPAPWAVRPSARHEVCASLPEENVRN
jgi:hypothetical protein